MVSLMCLHNIIYEILKRSENVDPGWWLGYEELQEQIIEKTGIFYTAIILKKHLQELKKMGRVRTEPIYNETGLFNGTGWFCVEP